MDQTLKPMNKLGFFLILLLAFGKLEAQNSNHTDSKTYVFVHGAWGGGWEYQKIDSILTAKGNLVFRPTMTGLGERVHLATAEIDLDTHIMDIVNTILFENLQGITLIGHSYGGMVISGVAEKIPDRINKLIYLDAFVPENGQSLFATMGPNGDSMTVPHTKDGFVNYFFGPTFPSPPTDVPQPLKTFTSPLTINNPEAQKIPTFYVLMTVDHDMNNAGFAPFSRIAKSRGWKILTLEGGHYPMRDQPSKLIEILEQCR
jgi:pimeloyl-ACP methyl ester carboxylesterase